MSDLFTYFPDATADKVTYTFSVQLKEDDDSTTTASVLASKFFITSLAGAKLASYSLGEQIVWNDTTKFISIALKNADLAFAHRDMEVTYNWWVELSDQRVVELSEGRGLVERAA